MNAIDTVGTLLRQAPGVPGVVMGEGLCRR